MKTKSDYHQSQVKINARAENIKIFRQLTGLKSIPSNRQYWTLCNYQPLDKGSEIVQTKPYTKHATFYYGKGIYWHDTAQGAMVYAGKMQNAEVQKLRDKAVKLQKKVIKFSPLV